MTSKQLPNSIEDLVGEGKKYKTNEEALKALLHAQHHIATLESEAEQARVKEAERESLAQMLDRLKVEKPQQNSSTDPLEIRPDKGPKTVEEPKVDTAVEPDLDTRIVQALEKKRAQEQFQANAAQVDTHFKNTFGDRAKEMFDKVAADSGMTPEEAAAFAAAKPAAFLRLASVGEPSAPNLGGDVRSKLAPVTSTTGVDKRLGELGELRRSNPNKWLSSAVQKELMTLQLQKRQGN